MSNPFWYCLIFVASLTMLSIHTFMGTNKKNPHAVALGKLGGSKGGKARAAKQTPEQRRESARQAALARWSGRNKKTQP